MRNLIWLMHTSLDGFMAGPKGELFWAGPGIDDELFREVEGTMSAADATLFGRRTYQEFESYWPAAGKNPASPEHDLFFSRWIEETAKIVASKSMQKLEWKNSSLLDGVPEGVARLKSQSGRDLLMFGSPGLAGQLWGAGLIDVLAIFVHPVVLGAGHPLMRGWAGTERLKMEQCKKLGSGVVALRYRVAGP